MAILAKSKLFNSPKFDSSVKSANTTGWEKWLGYFFGPMGPAILNVTIISYITVFYTDVLNMTGEGHSALWLGIFAAFPIVSKIIDAITNILMGQVIEKTRTRQGKARPWIFISAPLLSIACVLMFLIPQEQSVLQLCLVVLTYNVFFSFAYTIYNMSHTLMVPLSTTNVKQRDGLSLFTNMGVNMIPGVLVSMLFPMMILPVIGVDYHKWMVTMIVIAAVALPFTVLEYFFTKERVTEENAGEDKTKSQLPFRQQIKILFTDKYMVLMYVYFLVYTIGTTLKNLGLVYYCNYVLGTYNDGITQMLVSVIGGVPMGIGIFAVWPLAKKFGKRNVTMVGFLLYALGSLICWLFPTSLIIVLVGQFIKNIGGLPCAYVFMALFADCLDHLEWKKNIRMDGAAMSIYNIIAVAMVGIMTGVFNWMLATSGYIAPITAGSVTEAASTLAANGWTAQVALESLKPAADGVLTVAMQQPTGVNGMITIAFVGLEVFTGIILAVILWFINVEKNIAREQEEIKARRTAE